MSTRRSICVKGLTFYEISDKVGKEFTVTKEERMRQMSILVSNSNDANIDMYRMFQTLTICNIGLNWIRKLFSNLWTQRNILGLFVQQYFHEWIFEANFQSIIIIIIIIYLGFKGFFAFIFLSGIPNEWNPLTSYEFIVDVCNVLFALSVYETLLFLDIVLFASR